MENSSVRPLVYLTVRSVANGIKRSVTSGRRLIGVAFLGLYYVFLILRPFGESGSRRSGPPLPKGLTKALDPAIIEAAVFSGFSLLSLLYMAGLLSWKGGFKPADVDVLFPTPVSPRVVLFFRMVRDYLVSLFLPLFIAIVGLRPGGNSVREILSNLPPSAAALPRVAFIAVLLMTLTWVSVGYATSLYVDRSDLESEKVTKRIGWTLAAVVVLALGTIALMFRMDPSARGFVAAVGNPLVRLLFLPATAATAIVNATLTGSLIPAALGVLGLGGVAAVAWRVALSQSGWVYDQAAARGFDNLTKRDMMRSGDQRGLLTEAAKKGKLKRGRLASRLARLSPQGGLAIIWREMVVQARAQQALFYFSALIGAGVTGALLYSTAGSRRMAELSEIFYLMSLGLAVYTLTMTTSLQGFVEFLKKVDVSKPLPFSPTATVFWEVAAKTPPALLVSLTCAIVGIAVQPIVWPSALAGLAMGPSLALAMIATVMLTSILFPDFEDPTQRAFRGIMTLLGLVIGVGPGVAVAAAGVVAKLPVVVVAVPFALVNLGVAFLCCLLGGRLYADFNPSE